MAKYAVAYALAALIFGAMDAVWLSWAGPNLYEPTIGEIMADDFDLSAAGAFYLIYLIGIVYFGIRPGLLSGRASVAVLNGALLGALCYATFDLTSQAVFKVWATHISLMDIAWGAFATATTSGLTAAATLRLTGLKD